MSQPFKLSIVAPTTNRAAAKTWDFSADDARIMSVDCELKKEKKTISTMTVKLHDPDRKIFNEIPDCAYTVVGAKFYLGPPGNSSAQTTLVFDGKYTSYSTGFPGPSILTLVAHDNSIDARRQRRIRKLSNVTSMDIARKVAAEYKLELDQDTSLDLSGLVRRLSFLSLAPSDWDAMTEALHQDGLEVYVSGKKIKIRKAAAVEYSKVFSPDELLTHAECTINHIRGPGHGGDTQTAAPNLENSGTEKAAKGADAKGSATLRDHRRPVSGAGDSSGSHTEDKKGVKWSSQVELKRKRKDELTITTYPRHDLSLKHLVRCKGWGAKMDGLWEPTSIHHSIIAESASSTTTIRGQRFTGKQAANEAGTAAPAFANSKTGV